MWAPEKISEINPVGRRFRSNLSSERESIHVESGICKPNLIKNVRRNSRRE